MKIRIERRVFEFAAGILIGLVIGNVVYTILVVTGVCQ